MRWDITPTLAARVREMAQTRGQNADPRLTAIITRHSIPILDYSMWQRVVIPGISPTRTSIAARRPDPRQGPAAVFVGAVAEGSATIYYAPFSGTLPPSAFAVAETIAGAVDIALAFEGHYARHRDLVEFVTDGLPWVFWLTAGGELYGRHVGEAGGALLATGATSISAIMGAGAIAGDVSHGLVLAYTVTTGQLFTRQRWGGEWETAVLCSAAPANAADVALSRTWDYRVVLLIRDTGGMLWQLLGKSMIAGNANMEQIYAAARLTADVYATIPRAAQEDEHIGVAAGLGAEIYSTIPPVIVGAANIDDGTGNWGRVLRVTFSGPVYDIAGQSGAFKLGGVFVGEAIGYDPTDPTLHTLLLTMADFNSAASPSELVYTPGALASGPGVTLVEAQGVSVELDGLVPTAPPEAISAQVRDNLTIDVQFSEPLSSADIGANTAAFAVTGFEPRYSPGGDLLPATYVVAGVEFAPTVEDQINVNLSDGDFNDTQVIGDALMLEVDD